MQIFRFLTIFLCSVSAAVAQSIDLDELRLGSEAQIWNQRSQVEKHAYLEGLCQGLSATRDLNYLSQQTCSDPSSTPIGKVRLRICGVFYGTPEKATRYVDDFYKDKHHSDIPNWAALGAYNDRICEESNVQPRLAKLQEKMKCLRVLLNMGSVTPEARAKQQAVCDALPNG
ncbi:hypothetical protein [Hydrogenophaga pseudoflava]|uniref:hypothetical protein n=1 Tax=Hydrogenophaga pseudoflava TaxID=47421 RepID=UPI0010570E58|nr:hypothetical protein [Hydrogenophaga pseudoflava]